MDPRLRNTGPDQAADQRVRARRWNSQPLREDLPDDRAGQRAEDHVRVDDIGLDDAAANRFRHMQAEKQERYEIEKGGPDNRILRTQHAGGHDGRDRICGIVHAVEKVERQRDRDQREQEWQSERGGVHRRSASRRLAKHAR